MRWPRPAWSPEPVLRGALLVGTGLLYVVGLDRNGWGNSFYASAVQAGTRNWAAFFFGSSDAGNSITVDKPPASLWVMELSARVFGLSSWSLLVPEALMGVAAVALLAATVRRVAGPWAGLLAGLLLAVTPVAALMFRYDNPDALLTLLVVAAAWTTTRAVDDPRLRWPVATGVLLGTAFLAKSLQAFLVLPAMAAVLLVATAGPLRQRIGRLAAGGAALLVAAGWWPLAVSLVPRQDRPWVGDTTTDSPLDLAFGYNGLGRLAGERVPSGRGMASAGSPLRLMASAAGEAGWLLPAAGLALVAAALLLRGRPRTDPQRAALLLWGGWAVTTAAVFSTMQGIWHAYYTVELAPAVAALVALGATLLWRRGTVRALGVLGGGAVLTAGWAGGLLSVHLLPGSPLGPVIAAVGVAGALLLALRSGEHRRRLALVTAGLLVASAVLGPLAWSVVTVRGVHTGASVASGPGHRAARPAVSPQALALLRPDPDDWTWTGAVIGFRAGDVQLAAGAPVMPVGGFGGSDPSPTLAQFEADVAHHRVHWFVRGGHYGGQAGAIQAWVVAHAPAVHAGSTTLYDVGALATTRQDGDDRPPGHL